MPDVTEKLLYLLLGWLLGVLGSIFFDRFQRLRHRGEFTQGALTEARALKFKMAIIAYRMRSYQGPLEDDFIAWVRPILEGYDGPDKDPNITEAVRKLATMTPEQRRALHGAVCKPSVSPKPATYSLPFLESQMSNLPLCPSDFQLRLLLMKEQLDYFNQESRFFMGQYEKTFDPSIIGSNRDAVLANIEEACERLAQRARWITDAISELENASKTGFRREAS